MAPLRGVSVSCRGCWQPQPTDAQRLICGDVFCVACLASLARAALQSPAQLLPLRCCQQSVPADVIAAVLKPAELAFYQFLASQEANAKRARVTAGNQALVTKCDFCSRETALVIAQDAQELLLDCGHVYCRACLASMRKGGIAKCRDGVVCCQALVLTTSLKRGAKTATVITDTAAAKAELKPPATPGRRASPRLKVLIEGDGQGDQQHEELQDLKQAQCVTCATAMDAGTARVALPCGHVFCFPCVKLRCQRALKNEAQGSIGFPLRCCQKLLALDAIQPALGKREFLQYEALVAKRGDDIPRMLRSNKRKVEALEANATETEVEPETKRPRARPAKATGQTKAKAKAKVKQEPAEAKQESAVVKQAECVACMAPVDQSLRVPCGHVYCITCVGLMASHSLTDRARVPIRCCGKEFPIEYVKRVLSKPNMTRYERFLKEMDWRESSLQSDQEYARIVKKLRGKQCPTCGIGVQKTGGCDAMRCLRGHYFCWKCVAAPCTCGLTQLAIYGYVPPTAALPAPPAQAAAPALAPTRAAGKK